MLDTALQPRGLRRRLTWRSQVKALCAGHSHTPRKLAKSVMVE